MRFAKAMFAIAGWRQFERPGWIWIRGLKREFPFWRERDPEAYARRSNYSPIHIWPCCPPYRAEARWLYALSTRSLAVLLRTSHQIEGFNFTYVAVYPHIPPTARPNSFSLSSFPLLATLLLLSFPANTLPLTALGLAATLPLPLAGTAATAVGAAPLPALGLTLGALPEMCGASGEGSVGAGDLGSGVGSR